MAAFSKIIALVFDIFMFKPHVLQYNSRSFKIDCKPSGDFENTTASSAYKSMNNWNSSMLNVLLISVLIFCTISFINNINIRGELGSPCFKPIWELKKPVRDDLYRIHDLTTEYIEDIACTSFVLTCSETNFCHNRLLSILSNSFS